MDIESVWGIVSLYDRKEELQLFENQEIRSARDAEMKNGIFRLWMLWEFLQIL